MADKDTRIPRETNWPNVLYYLYLHFSAVIGLYLGIYQAKWTTIFYSDYLNFIYVFLLFTTIIFFTAIFLIYVSVLGLTAGAHRLWAHASFKASIILRQFLAFGQTLMCQVRTNWTIFNP